MSWRFSSWRSSPATEAARRYRRRLLLFAGAGLVATALGLVGYAFDAFRRTELETVDTRFEVRGEKSPPDDVVVVEIDDVTFDALELRWPFPRSIHGRVIDRLRRDGARAIAYDVQFTEPSDAVVDTLFGPANDELKLEAQNVLIRQDNELILAVQRAEGKVVLATTEVDARGRTRVLGGEAVVRQIGARAGNAILPTDPGGVNRRVPFSIDRLETLAVATTETATGRPVSPDGFGDDAAWIDYHGGPGTIPSYSFSDVVERETPHGTFEDKIVVVGPAAPSLQDVHPTSTSGDELMSGAEIQANAISTVRRGTPLESSSVPVDVLLIVLLGLAAPLASVALSALRGFFLALALAAIYLVATQLAFNSGTVLPVIYPLGALALAAVATLAVHYTSAAFERAHIRDVFSRFVPDSVVEQVLARGDPVPRLGGVERDATVMFSDLREFTGFAESLEPERVIDVLNRYLSEMSDVILDEGGTLVAYMGDGIMAVFGAPVEQEDHADRALRAARRMLEVLERFNEWIRSERLGKTFRIGIGLNSGTVLSGNVGSERRLEYTAVGDTTNTAARLEHMTKGTPHQVLVADSTRRRLTNEAPDLVYVEAVTVRGRRERIELWSLAQGQRPLAEGDGAAQKPTFAGSPPSGAEAPPQTERPAP